MTLCQTSALFKRKNIQCFQSIFCNVHLGRFFSSFVKFFLFFFVFFVFLECLFFLFLFKFSLLQKHFCHFRHDFLNLCIFLILNSDEPFFCCIKSVILTDHDIRGSCLFLFQTKKSFFIPLSLFLFICSISNSFSDIIHAFSLRCFFVSSCRSHE